MFIFFYLLFVRPIYGFNLAVSTPELLSTPDGQSNWFGYAIEFYKPPRGDPSILVGAPKTNTEGWQSGVRQAGTIYKCQLGQGCSPVYVDRDYATRKLNGSTLLPIDKKDYQYLGASISTDHRGRIVTCAPLYKYRYATFQKTQPTGECFVAKDQSMRFQRTGACTLEDRSGHHRFGYALCGFSVKLPQTDQADDHEAVFMGGPGAYYNQGMTMRWKPGDSRRLRSNATLRLHGMSTYEPELPETDDKSSRFYWKDSNYKAYSMALGDFAGGGGDDVAIGAPRGAFHKGQFPGIVKIYSSPYLTNLWNVSGEQDGEYFGAAIATCDVDGDGYVDLIIGAPFYSQTNGNKTGKKMKHEVGRVFVYYQERNGLGEVKFVRRDILTGTVEWGRFGHSVACAKDLNLDGVQDIIVGAPYAVEQPEAEDGAQFDRQRGGPTGAIYVFNGKSGGIRTKPSQVVFASELDTRLKAFGFSLTAGTDMDSNEYPDIAVGSYQSSQAAFLPARPIVKLDSRIEQRKNVLDLQNANCQVQDIDGKPVEGTCSKFTLCTKFDGRRSAASASGAEVTITVTLDVGAKEPDRILFDDGTNVMTTTRYLGEYMRGQHVCDRTSYRFHVNPNIRDKLSNILIHANYSVSEGDSSESPIMDYYGPQFASMMFEMKKDCGPDKICIPDLKLLNTHFFVCSRVLKKGSKKPAQNTFNCAEGAALVPGDHEYVNVSTTIENSGENAHIAEVFLRVPMGLEFMTHHVISGQHVICSPREKFKDEYHQIMGCELGNPMPAKSSIDLMFQLHVTDNNLKEPLIQIEVNSSNPEQEHTLGDNLVNVKIGINRDPKLQLFAISIPESVRFSSDQAVPMNREPFAVQLGPNVTHKYQIRNDGTVPYRAMTLDIFWPTKTAKGNSLLYIYDKPKIFYSGFNDAKAECYAKGGENFYNAEKLARGSPDQFGRQKREAAKDEQFVHTGLRNLVNSVKNAKKAIRGSAGFDQIAADCRDAYCGHIHCNISNLRPGKRWVMFQIESYLVLDTLVSEGIHRGEISSAAIAEITDIEHAEHVRQTKASNVATTTVRSHEAPPTADQIPWWIWVVAVLAAIVFLLLIALLLWKLGFFKRTRPPREQALLAQAPESDYYGYPKYGDHL